MLKTLKSIESTTRPRKGIIRVCGNGRARRDSSKLNEGKLDRSEFDDSEVDGGKVDDEIGKKSQKASKFKKLSKSKKMLESDFVIPRAKPVFTKLRQAFVKAPILHHFDPECHIQVETDASGYAIGRVFS